MTTLKEWLQNHDQAQREQLADKCSTSIGYLYQLAGGHRFPSLKLSMRIEKYTDGQVEPKSFLNLDAAS